MSKLALYIIFLLLINSCFAQSRRYVSKGYSIEHCTESIGIATKDTLSALWNFKTKKLIGELDASLFQFYPRTKCLLKITQDDSIYCYNLRFESPKLMFSGYQEVLVDVLTDFLVIYKGEMFDLGSEVHAINDQQLLISDREEAYNDATQNDYSGEVSQWVIMLGDNRFVTDSGEYSIITKENSEDELNKFNQAIGKNFDIIILCNS